MEITLFHAKVCLIPVAKDYYHPSMQSSVVFINIITDIKLWVFDLDTVYSVVSRSIRPGTQSHVHAEMEEGSCVEPCAQNGALVFSQGLAIHKMCKGDLIQNNELIYKYVSYLEIACRKKKEPQTLFRRQSTS